MRSWLIRKDTDAGKDWMQDKKGSTEDEMVGWHHWFNGHEFDQVPGDGEGQGMLAFYSPWGCRVGHDWETEQHHHHNLSWHWINLFSLFHMLVNRAKIIQNYFLDIVLNLKIPYTHISLSFSLCVFISLPTDLSHHLLFFMQSTEKSLYSEIVLLMRAFI